jgi:hypothetical protein
MWELLRVAGSAVGVACGIGIVIRSLLQLVVVIWSLRADDAGRRHAMAILRLLSDSRVRRSPRP